MKTLQNLQHMGGQTALITGGAGAIGLKMAETLIELGACVILCDMCASKLDAAAHTLKLSWPDSDIECVECDLEEESSREELAIQVVKDHPHLSSLIHCAAFVGTRDLDGWIDSFERQSLDTWRRAFEVNLTSGFHLSQLFLQALSASEGSITFLSSIYGVLGPDYALYEGTAMGNPAAYSASKGGVVQLTRWLSTTLAPYKVRVNCISPGGVARNQDARFIDRYKARTPLGRLACEDDFKGVIALLATNAGSYITGQNIMVDGGWSAW